MKKRMRPKKLGVVAAIFLVLSVALAAVLAYRIKREGKKHPEPGASLVEAPPDLAKYRRAFLSGYEALQRGDGADAVKHLSSFSFRQRAAEEYRLYFLANAHQLNGDEALARRTLSILWQRTPRLVYRDDVGFNLGALYGGRGDYAAAADIYGTIAARSETPPVEAAARQQYIESAFLAGDPAAIYTAARNLVRQDPKSAQAAGAIAIFRSLSATPGSRSLPLTNSEIVERAENLVRDGDPQSAIEELQAINADAFGSPLRERILLTRGRALGRMGKYEESDTALQSLFSGYFKYAVPALETSANNNRILFTSINPVENKTIKIKQRAGSVKVRVKGKKKLVTRPRYRTVTKTVKVINAKLQAKKDEFSRRYSERLRDLLQLPIDTTLRQSTMRTLAAVAVEKNQDPYLQQLVAELVKIDRLDDTALQHFWDKAWGAYSRGDLNGARMLLDFIANTYRNPNVQRQARYWLARTLDRLGNNSEANALYADLANAPYEDLYALFAEKHGAKRNKRGAEAARDERRKRPDWPEVAEKNMPPDLRLAYELNVLGDARDARLEVQKNANDANRKYADAILGELYYLENNLDLSFRFLRRAYPELATVEQDEVPDHFVAMYYPLKYDDLIFEYSRKRKLDPYLTMALIRQESAFVTDAKSAAGAVGLMQLMPPTARELGNRLYTVFTDNRLTKPEVSINLGSYYLRQLIDLNGGSVELALASYNAGFGNVRRWRQGAKGKPLDEFLEGMPFAETRNYVKRILLLRSTYEQLRGSVIHPENG